MNLYRSVWVPNEEIYRFNANMSESEDETRQRLKAAVHYTVGRMCHKLGEEHRREFSRQVVAAIAETAFRQCDIFAKDLEAFAKHAKRCTVSAEDVKLLARRSTALVSFPNQIFITMRHLSKDAHSPTHKMSCLNSLYFSQCTYRGKVKKWNKCTRL
ncbi:centromere protein S isoform X1 [Phycodurus eques]|uniref:centromere protein S isoform X1 n=1 Tax=Phycodurus eques TaxID=693459 RepID=UPI002ACEAD1D|nr:centromere protein S isoform X1 [Phycodurus eques]